MEPEENTDRNSNPTVCYPIFEVGMQFFFVSNERQRESRIVTVKKVGRKWVTLSDGHRFDRTSRDWRRVDGGNYYSPGRLWDNEQQHREHQQVQEILRAIEGKYRLGCESESVSLANAKQAAELLGVEVG